MLTALAKHGRFDLELECEGDLDVDDHHTAEDCALALGAALDQALGERRGIRRFGHAYAPLDEALARAVVDFSGRPSAHVDLGFRRERIGDIATENLTHVFVSLATAGADDAARRRAQGRATTTTAPRPRSRRWPWRCARRWRWTARPRCRAPRACSDGDG